jgi:cytochrome c553
MTPMIKPLLIAVLAAASLSATAGDRVAGEALAKKMNCAACHGADYNTPIDPSYPKLAGQHEDYLLNALRQYQRAATNNRTQALSRNNAIMGGQTMITDEQTKKQRPLTGKELADLAAYLSSLPTQLSYKHK